MPPKSAFGTTDIARLCQVTPPTVGRWIAQGKLPCFTTGGGHRRVWRSDLVLFLSEHNLPIPSEFSRPEHGRVLLVDDDDLVRRLMRRLLAESLPGVEVLEAADGFEAGRMIALFSPSLVILDFMLPGLDGARVCRQLRGDGVLPRVRVLAVSGRNEPAVRRACLHAGADDFLAKPFADEEFAARAAQLLPRVLETRA